MKKIYTLLALTAFTFGATAQNDFAVNLLSHTAGDTDDSDPMDFEFEVENVGTTTIPTGDTIIVSLALDGTITGLDLSPGFVNYIFLTEDFTPGSTVAVPAITGIDWLEQPAPTSIDFCGVVFGSGVASFSGAGPSVEEYIVGDDNTANNVSCITVELPVAVDDASVAELENALGQVYVSGEELIVVNESLSSSEANIKMVNMAGQTVYVENFQFSQGTMTFPVGNLNRGIYIVAIEVEGDVVTRKISIQ